MKSSYKSSCTEHDLIGTYPFLDIPKADNIVPKMIAIVTCVPLSI